MSDRRLFSVPWMDTWCLFSPIKLKPLTALIFPQILRTFREEEGSNSPLSLSLTSLFSYAKLKDYLYPSSFFLSSSICFVIEFNSCRYARRSRMALFCYGEYPYFRCFAFSASKAFFFTSTSCCFPKFSGWLPSWRRPSYYRSLTENRSLAEWLTFLIFSP